MDNLKLLAALTGKQKEATASILKYQNELKVAKLKLAPKFKDKTVMALRIRTGNLFLYPHFLQFSPDENKDNPKALEELQKNPIWKSLKAVKSGNVYVNLVDPLAQGGTAYSKFTFLEALMKTKLYTGK